MPWSAGDATKHHKGATGKKGKLWARVANQVLSKTGNEGRAIREANAVVNRFGGLSGADLERAVIRFSLTIG